MNNYKWFKFNDIFQLVKHNSIDLNKTKYGNINLIGLSGFNNGRRKRIEIDNYILLNEANQITIPLDGEYMGTAFYQSKEFATTQNVHIIKLKDYELNRNIGLYLCTILKKYKEIFFYGRKLTKNRIIEEKILLPSKNGKVDFEYMDNFIEKTLPIAKNKIINKNINLSKNISFNFSDWKMYEVIQLFNVKGSKTTKIKESPTSNYFYVTTKSTNNGVENYNFDFTEYGNVITVDSATNGKAFYQQKNFAASDHVEILEPKFHATKNILLFLATVLNEYYSSFYHYGYKRAQMRLKEEKILLPSKNGKVDFEYMDKYIEGIKYENKPK